MYGTWTSVMDHRLWAISVLQARLLTEVGGLHNRVTWQRQFHTKPYVRMRESVISTDVDAVDYILNYENAYDVMEA